MEVSQMRTKLKKAYNNAPSWVVQVNEMPDKQVMAIYFDMLEKGKLDPKTREVHEDTNQFTIFDY